MTRFLATASALAFAAVALVSQASAADLAVPRAPVYSKAPAYVPVNNWSGLYIGGNVGGGFGNGNTDLSFLPSPAAFGANNATLNNKPSGVIGGGQIGYNWQLGSIVTGLEADIQGSGIKGDAGPMALTLFSSGATISDVATSSQQLSWFGTVRGRLGVTVTPSLLLYGTGGLAYGQVKGTGDIEGQDFTPGIASGTTSTTKTGWTAGGGAEWMFTRGWSAKVEYLYVDLGKVSTAVLTGNPAGVGYTWHTQENIVRFGVNYHFN